MLNIRTRSLESYEKFKEPKLHGSIRDVWVRMKNSPAETFYRFINTIDRSINPVKRVFNALTNLSFEWHLMLGEKKIVQA